MKRPKKLSAAFVKTVTRPGRYGDGRGGHGLSMLVKPTTTGRLSKTWSQRLRVHDQPVNMGLGSYPLVTLAEARKQALENRREVIQGRDPRAGGIPTFAEAVERVIAMHRGTWRPGGRSEEIWRGSMRQYVFPRIGSKRVNKITTADVMGVLLTDDLWNQKRHTAQRVRQRIGAVMKWAVAQGYREDNPAGDTISAALPRNGHRVTHQKALPHGEVAAALEAVRSSTARPMVKLLFEMVVLTACRSGEVRLSRWSEVDLKERLWTIPGERTKTGREHRVPLSSGALSVLKEAKAAVGRRTTFVFPGTQGDKPFSAKALSRLVRRLEIEAVPHGFRSSFRDWCSETGVSREVAEACLAHIVKNKVEAAYARSDLLERRREVAQAWSDYVARDGDG